jgi:hypothetical protein
MKLLAAEADARWEAKPRVMEAPRGEEEPRSRLPLAEERLQQPVEGEDKATTTTTTTTRNERPSQAAKQGEGEVDAKDPWARTKAQGPSENWQPTAHDKGKAKKNKGQEKGQTKHAVRAASRKRHHLYYDSVQYVRIRVDGWIDMYYMYHYLECIPPQKPKYLFAAQWPKNALLNSVPTRISSLAKS